MVWGQQCKSCNHAQSTPRRSSVEGRGQQNIEGRRRKRQAGPQRDTLDLQLVLCVVLGTILAAQISPGVWPHDGAAAASEEIGFTATNTCEDKSSL